ncbi:MAG: type 1 glutamine amidotransferase [Pseudomonadota bacterium]|nr:type 1 glutamine amidotransferase [Pseudomonadota bacterium]
MHIGILQTGHAPKELSGEFDDYDLMFQSLLGGHDFTFATYDVESGTLPDSAAEADGWLITGSRHGAYEDHPWIAPLETLIREIKDKGQPLVGVCFGHQIIAQALGGKVEKYPGGWAIGRTEYDMGDRKIALNAWHQDQVTELPAGATVLASNDFCANASVSYGDSILTIQPHPEYDADFIAGLIRTRGKGVVPPELLHSAGELLTSGPVHKSDMAAMMANVFQTASKS